MEDAVRLQKEQLNLAEEFHNALSGSMQLVLDGLLTQAKFGGDLLDRTLLFDLHGIDAAHLPGKGVHGAPPYIIYLFILVLLIGKRCDLLLVGHFFTQNVFSSFRCTDMVANAMLNYGVQVIAERGMNNDSSTLVPQADKYFLQNIIRFFRFVQSHTDISMQRTGIAVEYLIKSSYVPRAQLQQ